MWLSNLIFKCHHKTSARHDIYGGLPWHRGAWHIPKPPWHTAMTYVMAVCHAGISLLWKRDRIYMSWQYTHGVMHVCHGDMSWRVYVMAVCHGSSEGFYMSCGMSWHVMSWRYVMHVPEVSCMYQICHWVCHAGVSCRNVMVICHWDFRYVMQVCHGG